MLVPTIDMAVKKTKSGRIGIMATQTSIDSHVHKKLLLDRNSELFIFEQACPDFVPLIESQAPQKDLDQAIENYLKLLLKSNIDTLILGCTHYAFLEKLIQKQAPKLTLISAANCIKSKKIGSKQPKITIQTTANIKLELLTQLQIQHSVLRVV
ncbi:MAG: glutamate racemase [Alteromonas naphthalenivorans]|jgi:glutamate racemase